MSLVKSELFNQHEVEQKESCLTEVEISSCTSIFLEGSTFNLCMNTYKLVIVCA